MEKKRNANHIAYRCPECGVATVGLLGGLGSIADLLRLRCECEKSGLDIQKTKDGKIHLSVPCVYCKDAHGYTLTPEILTRDEPLRLSCPFSGMDIFFLADGEKITACYLMQQADLT